MLEAEPTPQTDLRQRIREHYTCDEAAFIAQRRRAAGLSGQDRAAIERQARTWVEAIREHGKASLMEQFFLAYGLDTAAGTALMSLAEALPRVDDPATAQALIADKLRGVDWLGSLQMPGLRMRLLAHTLALVARLLPGTANPAWLRACKWPLQGPIRLCTRAAIARFGRQFVLGEDVNEAMRHAGEELSQGYTHSIDMLGEAARTEADALAYLAAYRQAIAALKPFCKSSDLRANPGISVKLSALYARYEATQVEATWQILLPRVLELAVLAAEANMSLNIDAEEMDRLELSLDIIDALLRHPELKAWPGLGVVVQAYGYRAPAVLDWLHAMALAQDRRLMVRLVKGAYWDSEIKRAQVQGLQAFPVLTRKVNTDLAYLACARQLLAMRGRIYPQFATHNAHTMAAVLHLAGEDRTAFEFQRLHGMGAELHARVSAATGTRCRIYAPVGAQRDLLAYLVRRLLENGANSSFVRQLADHRLAVAHVAGDPFSSAGAANPAILPPAQLFAPERTNSRGWDLADSHTLEALMAEREQFAGHTWRALPLPTPAHAPTPPAAIVNPARLAEQVGEVSWASARDVALSLARADAQVPAWSSKPIAERAACLEAYADALQTNTAEFAALLCREAGKTLADALAEVREAVDFARYYAAQARALPGGARARGVVVCISPWNFPLAIFSGQILAALVTGNTVLAKPAEQTPLVAYRAAQLMLRAGVDAEALQLLPGSGEDVGAALTRDPRVAAVCFTGSLVTARVIAAAMAAHLNPAAPLIAETGGINAMIVDGTALLEQAVHDVLTSAFQSAGQRCSALRIVYVQADIAASFIAMLCGAMDLLRPGDPWHLATDLGPVIDDQALGRIRAYIEHMNARGQVLKSLAAPKTGRFIGPTLIRVSGIEALTEEIFGPVLHIATFPARDLGKVIDAVNAAGYGLTFGLHSRLSGRRADIAQRIRTGNVYLNRNQIGAIVGSQPFGGLGLSGTGPKAGGPHYLPRLCRPPPSPGEAHAATAEPLREDAWLAALTRIDALAASPHAALTRHCLEALVTLVDDFPEMPQPHRLPGPVGEDNRLTYLPRGLVVCLGRSERALRRQVLCALLHGNRVLAVAAGAARLEPVLQGAGLPFVGLDGDLPAALLECRRPLAAVCCVAEDDRMRSYRRALARRPGTLVALLTDLDFGIMLAHEKSISTDTTAAGGNASLLAQG